MKAYQRELTNFEEKEQCLKSISEILIHPIGSSDSSRQYEFLKSKLNKYQEQPLLLDPHLRELSEPVMNAIKDIMVDKEKREACESNIEAFPFQVYKNPKLHRLFQIIYLLCKIRGAKTIVKIFPHEVCDLEPTLRLLQSQDQSDYSTWETRYVLFLWLSMLSLVPFDLSMIDSSLTPGAVVKEDMTLVGSIISLGKFHLKDPGATKEAAALCLARILTRPDMESSHVTRFLDWATRSINNIMEEDSASHDKTLEIIGIILTLCHIIKFSHRHHHKHLTELYTPSILRLATFVNEESASAILSPLQTSSILRKLLSKVVQRIGMAHLPPKVMSWRYSRGKRSLALSLIPCPTEAEKKLPEKEIVEDQIDIPPVLEDLVEILLCRLRDHDTIVRWSAAKGIGRITERLPFEFADDIVQSVVEIFNNSEGANAWHGGALAVAELVRRGLLLPQRLPHIVEVIKKALLYDVRRGSNSVGSHVRDAACYMCWAFARAYAPTVLRPYVLELSKGMLITALFDREVHCRRAASAAFQENVGRQGHENFQHGIEILTRADYYALGMRKNSYLELSFEVAKYLPYRNCLIDHILRSKLFHWDKEIRLLSAKTLGRMCQLNPQYMVNIALPYLIPLSLSTDFILRHGSLHAIAEIVLALARIPLALPGEVSKGIRNIVPKIEKARLYRGKGGEFIRGAVCRLIECIALSNEPLSKRTQWRLLDTLHDCLKHPNDEILMQAVRAYRALTNQYFSNPLANDLESIQRRTVRKYVDLLKKEKNVASRRGYARALGSSPREILASSPDTLYQIVDVLIQRTKIEDQEDDRDAESRKAAIAGLSELVSHVGIENSSCKDPEGYFKLSPSIAHKVLDCFLESLNDYCIDSRGDVGSWVRKESMIAIEKLIYELSKAEIVEREEVKNTCDIYETKYGLGELVSTIGCVKNEPENDEDILVIRFPPNSFGYVYFGSSHCGRIKRKATKRVIKSCDDDFHLPSLKERLISMKSKSIMQPMRINRFITAETMNRVVGCLGKQFSEKLDVIRGTAGEILYRLIHSSNPWVPCIPDRPNLEEILVSDDINFSSAKITFPLVVQMMSIPSYLPAISSGIIISIGGLTESVVKYATSCIVKWMKGHLERKNFGVLSNFCYSLLGLFVEYSKEDRVTVPLLKTLGILMERSLFDFLHKDGPKFGIHLYEAVCLEIKTCSEVSKIISAVNVLIGLLPSEENVEKRSLRGLLVLLGHRLPKVRRVTSEQLYTRIIMHEELVDEDKIEEILEILSDTPWDKPLSQVRPIRDSLYPLFRVEKIQDKNS